MKQIKTTDNSIQLIDDEKTIIPVYEKGDLDFKVADTGLYCYSEADARSGHEIFQIPFPVKINATEYTDVDTLLTDGLDILFKSTIDAETLSTSIEIDLKIEGLMEEMKAAFDIVRANQETGLTNDDAIKASLASIDSKLSTLQTMNTNLVNINSSLATVNTSINNMNTNLAGLLQQIVDKP